MNGARCAGAISGVFAGAAYLATMAIDNRATGARLDDLLLLGRPLARDPRTARRVGLAIHVGNAAALGVVYGALVHDRLPGSRWLRGVLFACVENAALYPVTALDRIHPAVREDLIDRYWTWAAFAQSFPRHVAYGAVLGLLYGRLAERLATSQARSESPSVDQ